MLLDAALILGGALALAFAGDRLVDFAVAIAEKARVSPAVIALTIVAAGTSAPELVVSVTGALQDSPGIAMGNVVGSNIANIGLVLASCALIAPMPVAAGVMRFEYPFLLLASWITLLLSRDGWLDRLEGAFFLASMIGFTAYVVSVARRQMAPVEPVPDRATGTRTRPTWLLVIGILGSLIGLMLAAQALVAGAVGIAHTLGVSERVVGLTVVAIGTSLPELAVSVVAALKKQQEMALANVVGSNIFNLLMILGVASLVRPIAIEERMLSSDLWVMLAFAVLLLPLVFRRAMLTRAGGGVLLAAYVCYLGSLARDAR